LDTKTINKIRKGISQGLRYERELQEKREQKLWRHVSEPFRLESMLNSLSETELEYPGFFLDLTKKGIFF
jgi:hypothetical protein